MKLIEGNALLKREIHKNLSIVTVCLSLQFLQPGFAKGLEVV